jgi:hypothetical protein
MIIIKDVPGLTNREILEALIDITDPDDPPIATGHGGFVVDEDTAERFLSAYLIAAGRRPAPTVEVAGDDEQTGPAPIRTTTRRAGKRKEGA